MKLIVVRHAIAEEHDPQVWPDDSLRPLTRRGRRRFADAARGIGSLVPGVDLVLSSPYVRAWDTAMLLQKHAGWPSPQVCNELRYDPPDSVLQAIEPYRGLVTLALVGHEPHLSRLISHVLSPPSAVAVELRKGAAACMELSETGAKLLWLMQPRALRLLT
jgi:phosphohistidine phosphatase